VNALQKRLPALMTASMRYKPEILWLSGALPTNFLDLVHNEFEVLCVDDTKKKKKKKKGRPLAEKCVGTVERSTQLTLALAKAMVTTALIREAETGGFRLQNAVQLLKVRAWSLPFSHKNELIIQRI
jgi:hypothetical protein